MQPAVYIMASSPRGTLYTGVTSDLIARAFEHRSKAVPGFTQRYGVTTLVWFEAHPTMESAIRREKAIKEWRRAWKLRLVETTNPAWADLYSSLV